MKKSIIALSAAALAATVLLTSVNGNNAPTETTNVVYENKVQKYILKDFNGRIAVFCEGSETPNEIFEIYTKTLPAEDAEKIEKGIEISGFDKLTEILADYTS